MKKRILFFGLFAIIFPTLMFAATPDAAIATGNASTTSGNPFDTGLDKLMGWTNKIAMLLIGATVIAIFWGAFMFIFNFEGKKEDGKKILMWGIIVLFIMVALWGIVGVLKKATVGDNNDAKIKKDLAIPGLGN